MDEAVTTEAGLQRRDMSTGSDHSGVLATVLSTSESGQASSSPLGSDGNKSGRHLEAGVEVRDGAVKRPG